MFVLEQWARNCTGALCGITLSVAGLLASSQAAVSSGPVGAAMAVLATFQDADVLPPEGTREANRVIQVVIQFQSAFMKSGDPTVQHFLQEAFTAKFGDRADTVASEFRKTGWTSDALEALSDLGEKSTEAQRSQLAAGFRAFNLTVADFERLIDLFVKARSSLSARGENIHSIFAQRRREMPGHGTIQRREEQHGDKSLYLDQGQGGPKQRGVGGT